MNQVNNDVSQQETLAFFTAVLEDPFNSVCYECGRKTRQWIQTELAIYLCLNCSALYKQTVEWAKIKCINIDSWAPEELVYIKNGGNRKLRQFLSNYEMQQMTYRERLHTKAVLYYRTLLQQQFNGREAPMAPDPVTGKQLVGEGKKLGDMSKEQLLQEMKSKTIMMGTKTIQFGSKAFTTVHQKITSGQLKEDAVKVVGDVGTKAKDLWGKLMLKFDSLTD